MSKPVETEVLIPASVSLRFRRGQWRVAIKIDQSWHKGNLFPPAEHIVNFDNLITDLAKSLAKQHSGHVQVASEEVKTKGESDEPIKGLFDPPDRAV